VDAETDSKIRSALRSQMKNATCILISHRISTLMEADQIVVMGRGTVLEQGTHQELLAKNGLYRQIHDLQLECETEGNP
jgi:ATP-binding cassette subfamily B protein